jgi:hypothetical protein
VSEVKSCVGLGKVNPVFKVRFTWILSEYGAGFGDEHLGPLDQGRDVGGIGVAVTHEAA